MGEGGTLPLIRQRVPAHGAAVLEAGGGEVGRGQSEASIAAGDQSGASIQYYLEAGGGEVGRGRELWAGHQGGEVCHQPRWQHAVQQVHLGR